METAWFTGIALSTEEIFLCWIYLVAHPHLRGPVEVNSASCVDEFWLDFVDVAIS